MYGNVSSVTRTATEEPSRLVAFVARGKVFSGGPGRPLSEIHSKHVQAITDRAERSRAMHAWKEGTTFGIRAGGQLRQSADDATPLQATAVQFVDQERLLYFLRDRSAGGLFERNLVDGSEKRLLHRQNLLLDDLRVDLASGRMLASQLSKNGAASIVSMELNGDGYRELTAGDTIDASPAFVPGKPNEVLFQSAGLARSQQGYVLAQGPFSIQHLDIARGTLTPVCDDPGFDHLQPRVAPGGDLLFIRRPYEAVRYRTSDALLDTLYFPFRVLRALFHYLNFFSLMYARKPLTSASGPEVEADLKHILVKGRHIDAETALRKRAFVSGVPSLVPASWQLVRRTPTGEEHVLAKHVVAYDVAPDGTVLFSNGNGVFAVGGDGAATVVFRDRLVGEIAAG